MSGHRNHDKSPIMASQTKPLENQAKKGNTGRGDAGTRLWGGQKTQPLKGGGGEEHTEVQHTCHTRRAGKRCVAMLLLIRAAKHRAAGQIPGWAHRVAACWRSSRGMTAGYISARQTLGKATSGEIVARDGQGHVNSCRDRGRSGAQAHANGARVESKAAVQADSRKQRQQKQHQEITSPLGGGL